MGLNIGGDAVNPFCLINLVVESIIFSFGGDDILSCTVFLSYVCPDFTKIFFWLSHLVIFELGMETI